MTVPALAVLGRGLVDPDQPVLRADDLGVQRGDGIFETARVANGRVVKFAAHLARLRRSADRMALDLPDEAPWREHAAAAIAASGAGDGLLKLVCTRGPVAGGPVTAFVLVLPTPASVVAARERGVAAVTLALGVDVAARMPAPWLLTGVKTTSYAVNMASLREAEARGADEAIWLGSRGEILEAPTATVCWVRGGVVYTPPADVGVLDGTTAAVLPGLAAAHGIRVVPCQGTVDDLRVAEEVFLTSSVRGVAPVHTLDGKGLGIGPVTVTLRDAVEEWVRRETAPAHI